MKKVQKGILGFVITGVIIALMAAAFISPLASAFPDGLEKVAEDYGFIDKATTAVNESFFIIRDYSFSYITSEKWQGPIAGLSGVLIIAVIFGFIYLIYRAATVKNARRQKFISVIKPDTGDSLVAGKASISKNGKKSSK